LGSHVTVDRDALAKSSLDVAPLLLGSVLVSTVDGAEVAVRLTEVEAYNGMEDPASHAYRGQTARNVVMFGPAGFLYCYFTYGMHWCANVVCGPEGVATAVLLRAGEVVRGLETAKARRSAVRATRELARGPARLASCLALDRDANGLDLCDPVSPVRLESLGPPSPDLVRSGPRVGIAAATDRPWRFWLEGEASVSAFRVGGRKRMATRRQTGTS
jgi:DNA-3-methyladenine glycosylase